MILRRARRACPVLLALAASCGPPSSVQGTIKRADVAWSSLARCLAGDRMRSGERPTVRLRRIERGQPTAGDTAGAWPRRCAPYAASLRQEVLAAKDIPRFDRLQLYLFDLEGTLADGHLPADADEMWQAAALAKLGSAPAPDDVPAPPEPAEAPLAAPDFTPLSDGTSHQVNTVLGGPLEVLFELPPRLCRFDVDARVARCRAVQGAPAAEGSRPILVDGDPGAPPLLRVIVPPARGIFGVDGATQRPDPGTAAYAFADGSIGWIKWQGEDGYQVTRDRGAVLLAQVPMGDGEDFRFLGDQLVWLSPHGPGSERLVAMRVPGGPDAVPSMLVLATVPKGAQVEACHSGVTRATVVGPPPDAASGTISIALAPDGRWLPAVARPVEHWNHFRLDCAAGAATVTWLEPDIERGQEAIHQIRCTDTDCQDAQTEAHDLGRGEVPLAADLSGHLLLVWYHDDDSVRMRLGDIHTMDRAPEAVLIDAPRFGGLEVEDLELYTQPDAAIILAGTPNGLYAIRVDPDGKFEPVRVVEEK